MSRQRTLALNPTVESGSYWRCAPPTVSIWRQFAHPRSMQVDRQGAFGRAFQRCALSGDPIACRPTPPKRWRSTPPLPDRRHALDVMRLHHFLGREGVIPPDFVHRS